MLKGIYESMSMDMKPNHEEILWLIEQAEKVEQYEDALIGIKATIINESHHYFNKQDTLDCIFNVCKEALEESK